MSLKNFTKNNHTFLYITYSAILIAIIVYYQKAIEMFVLFFNLFLPLILGFAIAYVLNVFLIYIETIIKYLFKKLKLNLKTRLFSLILTIALTILILSVVLQLILPEIQRTGLTIINDSPYYWNKIQVWYNDITDQSFLDFLPQFKFDNTQIINTITNFIKEGGINFFQATTSVFGSIINFSLGFIIAMYMLLQKEKLLNQMKKSLYALTTNDIAEEIIKIFHLSNKIFSGFVKGQFVEAVILGVLCYIGMIIFRMPYPVMISCLLGITALVPIVGPFVGISVGAFLILMVNPWQALFFIIYIMIIQQIDGNFIYPRVVGTAIGLPGLWVIVAISVGGGLYGISGILLGVPTVAILYALFKEYVNMKLKKKGIDLP